MQTARSLRHFVKKVEKKGFFDAHSDILLFEGAFVAVPVLWAFAVELALKAVLYRGGHPKEERTHDLGHLYEKLNKEVRDRIEERMLIPASRDMINALDLDVYPDYMSVGKLLEHYKNAFVDWRYLYENRDRIRGRRSPRRSSFHHGALDRALTAIISVYDEDYSNCQ